jgi:hypothetical protein
MPLLFTLTTACRYPQSVQGLAVAEAAEHTEGAGLSARRFL